MTTTHPGADPISPPWHSNRKYLATIDARHPLPILSAEDYRGFLPQLTYRKLVPNTPQESENLRAASLVGLLYVMAELFASSTLGLRGTLGYQGNGHALPPGGHRDFHFSPDLIFMGPNGELITGRQAERALSDPADDSRHQPGWPAQLTFDRRPEVALMRHQFIHLARTITDDLLLDDFDWSRHFHLASDMAIAEGPSAADIARQWTMHRIAARIESAEMAAEMDFAPHRPSARKSL